MCAEPGRRAFASALAAAMVSLVAACGGKDQVPAGQAEVQQTPAAGGDGDLTASEVRAVQLASQGESVVPVTGLRLSLAPQAAALTPESIATGWARVVYVWSAANEWGYLSVEGPHAFELVESGAAQAAGHAVRQQLVSEGVPVTEVLNSVWEGFKECSQIGWTQYSVPPGWRKKVQVDALEIFLVDMQARTYTVTAYVPRGDLAKANPAFVTLCSAASGDVG